MEKNFREKNYSSKPRAEKSDRPRRSNSGERNFKPRRSDSDERPYRSRRSDSNEKPYRPRRNDYDEKPFRGRRNDSEEKQYRARRNDSNGKPFKSRMDDSEERPRRANPSTQERPYKARRTASSSIKPYSKSYENDRPYERKPYKRPEKKNYSDNRDSIKNSNNAPKSKSNSDEIRLNKFIANSGVCSRREADQYIQTGLVTVNGKVVTELGSRVKPTDEVRFDGTRLKGEKKVYIIMNKPKDYVTTLSDPHAEHTVMDLIDEEDCPERIYPVGRLDKSTTGILLLTNDGDLTKKLTHPAFGAKKVYQVTLNEDLKKDDFDQILNGIELEDGEIHADAISYLENDKSTVGIEIHSGRNRIVRRIFESLGYNVKKLDRVMFAGLTKKALRRGEWRFLTDQEVNILKMGGY